MPFYTGNLGICRFWNPKGVLEAIPRGAKDIACHLSLLVKLYNGVSVCLFCYYHFLYSQDTAVTRFIVSVLSSCDF